MRLVVAALLLGLGVTTGSSTPAVASSPRCEGHRATVLGRPDGSVTGTPRRDVVVTNGAEQVTTFGGDDLVCVTGRSHLTSIASGRGDDRVVVVGAAPTSVVGVRFGTGADSFVGGAEHDGISFDDGGDLARTGPNSDYATVSSRVADSAISLGPGRDSLGLSGGSRGNPDGYVASVAGGDGSDRLVLSGPGRGDAQIDNSVGSLAFDGDQALAWSSVERFSLGAVSAGTLTFIGSDGAEVVRLDSDSPGDVEGYSVALGGGDDNLRVAASVDGTADGGPGSDTFRVFADGYETYESLWADLGTGQATTTYHDLDDPDGDVTYTWTMPGFENLNTDHFYGSGFADVTVRGTPGPNRVSAAGCTASLTGLGGNDFLRALGGVCRPSHTRATLDGGDGDDRLVGSEGPDTLDGGSGSDTADGRGGRDTCDAEHVVDCENP